MEDQQVAKQAIETEETPDQQPQEPKPSEPAAPSEDEGVGQGPPEPDAEQAAPPQPQVPPPPKVSRGDQVSYFDEEGVPRRAVVTADHGGGCLNLLVYQPASVPMTWDKVEKTSIVHSWERARGCWHTL